MAGATGTSRPRLRVAYYTDAPSRGGAEVCLRNLLSHLPAQVDPVVVGTAPDIVEWVAAARPGTSTVVLPEIRGKGSLGPIWAHRQAFARLQADVIHLNLNTMADARWAVLAATTVVSRVVVVEHLPLPPAGRSVRLIKRLGSRRVDAHVAVGEQAARLTEAAVGLRPGSVRTVHNGVPAPPASRRAPAPDGVVVLGTLARLDHIKGLDLLVDATAALPPTVRVLILGEGPLRDELELRARTAGVGDRVELRGWVDDAGRCLAEMDVFVLPSRNEGFPLSIVEAMLVGLPVVATDVGSVTEAVVDGVTGRVVPADDLPALVEALVPLVASAARRTDLGDAGRAVASRRFTADVMAARYVELYGELLAD